MNRQEIDGVFSVNFVGPIQSVLFCLYFFYRSKSICGMKKGHKNPIYHNRRERKILPRRGENIRKRKDGRWEARFPKGKNQNGNTVYGAVYGATYKEAKEKRRRLLENPATDQANRTDSSFGNLLTLWIADNKVRLKASTIYRYQYLIDTHILPELGIRSVDSIRFTYL